MQKEVIYQRMGDMASLSAAFAEVVPRIAAFVGDLREQAHVVLMDAIEGEERQWLVAMGRSPNDGALETVNRAIELDPENQFLRGTRLGVYRAMNGFERLAEGIAEAEESMATFVRQFYQ